MFNLKRISLLGAATCSLMTSTAVAQASDVDYFARDKYEAVLDRRQAEFDPEPIRLGAFLANPSLDAGLVSDSNVFATDNNEESDLVARIGATVAARTDWNVNEVNARVSLHRNEYLDLSEESNNDFRARVGGRLDVNRDLSLNGAVFYEDRTEARTNLANTVPTDGPVQFTRTGVRAGANYTNGRIQVSGDVTASETDFEDTRLLNNGAVFDQDFRDLSTLSAGGRVAYALNPDFAVYGQGRVVERDYDNEQVVGLDTFSRDASGYSVQAGVDFELQTLLRGDIAVGFLEEERDDARFDTVDGLSVDAVVQWFPSRLTTVTFDASRRVQDMGILQSPSAVATRYGARVDHELLRNVVLSAYGQLGNFEFDDIDRDDDTSDFGVEGIYKVNKQLHLQAFARRVDRDTSGAAQFTGQSFDKNLIGVGLKFYPY